MKPTAPWRDNFSKLAIDPPAYLSVQRPFPRAGENGFSVLVGFEYGFSGTGLPLAKMH